MRPMRDAKNATKTNHMIISRPQISSPASVSRLMLHVGYALIPGTVAMVWVFGASVLIQIVLACLTAIITESFVLILRKRPVLNTLADGSALLTAVLLALAIPSIAPWWIIVLGTAFAILFGKQLYGGIGYNPFNPAMLGYVILLIAFPLEMTRWPAPLSLLDHSVDLQTSFEVIFNSGLGIDTVSGATPLDTIKTQLSAGMSVQETLIHSDYGQLFGRLAGVGWEYVSLGFLLGGLYLLLTGRISWQIPTGVLASITVLSSVFYLIDPEQFISPSLHLLGGATMLGAFFIATDPVSAATTPRGRLYYGIGIGILCFIIRTWGNYPEGMAFAVLLMNMAAPTIDHYTPTRVFGQGKN